MTRRDHRQPARLTDQRTAVQKPSLPKPEERGFWRSLFFSR